MSLNRKHGIMQFTVKKKNIEHSNDISKARDQVNKRPIKIVHAKPSVIDWTRF